MITVKMRYPQNAIFGPSESREEYIFSYESGVLLEKVARDQQKHYPSLIVLARVDGLLRELFLPVLGDCTVEFVTLQDNAGSKTYLHSLVFLMIRAFQDVAGVETARKLYVQFTVSNGLFGEIRGEQLDPDLVARVKNRMQELTKEDLPILKRSVNCRDAIRLFTDKGMLDKAKLFHYRLASQTNIYSLGDYQDYFYAYMVPSTGYLKYFDLIPYRGGFILQRPTASSPDGIRAYLPQEKLFTTMKTTALWADHMGLNSVSDLNDLCCRNGYNDLILLQEAIMEKQIGDIASRIVETNRRLVLIAGPSSSGKTTFSHRLSIQLKALGKKLRPIACDDYFKRREEYPLDEAGKPDYESILCVDTELLNQNLLDLLAGKKVELPAFNFKTGQREYRGNTLEIGPEDILVLEGIHCLNDALTNRIPPEDKFRIYISALTTLNIDAHNVISTSDGRLIRRIVRDARTRGISAAKTIAQWPQVRAGEEKNIFPYQESADVMFNSSLIYELAVLKPYVVTLLFGISKDEPEYPEAWRLLKFLDYFLAIPSERVPATSLVREFIGGGCFDVD